MKPLRRDMYKRQYMSTAIVCTSLIAVVGGIFWPCASLVGRNGARPGTPGGAVLGARPSLTGQDSQNPTTGSAMVRIADRRN
jgi:hypothetical protein